MTQTSTPPDASAVPPAPDGARANDGAPVRIRPLRANSEFQACVDLQRDIWGWEQSEIVPATLLHVVEYVGGLAVGAFDKDDHLLGFVFGLTGPRHGELAHWSHMLGVRESTRDHGVGRMLKEHQRDVLRGMGVARIFWSFDPLQSKNAYFNVNRLGAVVDRYVPDMYGTTASPLHLGMPTDRLVVSIATEPRAATPVRLAADHALPIVTAFPRPGDQTVTPGDEAPDDQTTDAFLLEIPEDILAVLHASMSEAKRWRSSVRDHFQWALRGGYTIGGVHRDVAHGRTFYVMTRELSQS